MFLHHHLYSVRKDWKEARRLLPKQLVYRLQVCGSLHLPSVPARGRSLGRAPGSSTDQPMPSSATKAGRTARRVLRLAPLVILHPTFLGGIGMSILRVWVRPAGFAVAGKGRPKAPAVPPRAVSATASGAGGRAHTRSRAVRPIQTSTGSIRTPAAKQLLSSSNTSGTLSTKFSEDRLCLWRDDHGGLFHPSEPMPCTFLRSPRLVVLGCVAGTLPGRNSAASGSVRYPRLH